MADKKDKYSEAESAKRVERALRAALSTPPKPRKAGKRKAGKKTKAR